MHVAVPLCQHLWAAAHSFVHAWRMPVPMLRIDVAVADMSMTLALVLLLVRGRAGRCMQRRTKRTLPLNNLAMLMRIFYSVEEVHCAIQLQ